MKPKVQRFIIRTVVRIVGMGRILFYFIIIALQHNNTMHERREE